MGEGWRIATVIPAQAGIQKCLIGSRPVFGSTVLDSRLRGNDGCYMRLSRSNSGSIPLILNFVEGWAEWSRPVAIPVFP